MLVLVGFLLGRETGGGDSGFLSKGVWFFWGFFLAVFEGVVVSTFGGRSKYVPVSSLSTSLLKDAACRQYHHTLWQSDGSGFFVHERFGFLRCLFWGCTRGCGGIDFRRTLQVRPCKLAVDIPVERRRLQPIPPHPLTIWRHILFLKGRFTFFAMHALGRT